MARECSAARPAGATGTSPGGTSSWELAEFLEFDDRRRKAWVFDERIAKVVYGGRTLS
jgi:hypothetical protein